jgi:hypothetical protein
MKSEISNELYEAARRLGAKFALLTPIGSWGDTREDEYVLETLRQWNDAHVPEAERNEPLDLDAAIQREIYIAFEHLGADPQLLGLLGSWGDGYDDEAFLKELRDYLRRGSIFDDIDVRAD